MNVSLNHEDIQTALKDFVRNQIKVADGVSLNINVTCGRGANATSATVELISADSLAAGPEKPAKAAKPPKKDKPTKAAEEKTEPPTEVETNDEPEPTTDETEVSTEGGLFDE